MKQLKPSALRPIATVIILLAFCAATVDAQGRRARKAAKAQAAAVAAETDKASASWDVTDTPGASKTVQVDVTEGTWMNLDVSSDGERIVFDLLGDLYLLPITGGEAEALTTGAAWDMQPRFSPDGTEVAFTSDRAGGDNIWVIDLEDRTTRQVSKETFRLPNHPAWSPDGDFIAARKHFSSRRSLGSGEIWLWHRSGEGSGLKLNDKPNEQKDLGEPAFSPDGRYVYFSQDTTPGGAFQYSKDSNGQIYEIRRIDRLTGEIDTVVSGPGGAVAPTPSPDGKTLAFVRRVRSKTALFIKDLDSGKVTQLFDGLDRDMQEIWAIHGVYANFAWTPDSSALVFWAGGKIHRIEVASQRVDPIPFRAVGEHQMKEALRFAVDVVPEGDRPMFHTKMLRWTQVSPTGSAVVFQTLGKLWVRSITQDEDGVVELGPANRLTNDASDRFEFFPRISRDGTKVVYSTWSDRELGTVQVVRLDAGGDMTPQTVIDAPGHYAESVLSPDGRALVYRRTGGGYLRTSMWSDDQGLYRVWLDPESSTPLAGERGLPVRLGTGSDPHFGASSDRVFYRTFASGEFALESRSLDGAPTTEADAIDVQRHALSTNATEFRVSPDGKTLAFSERFQARIVPLVDAGDPLSLSESVGTVPFRTVSRDAGDYLHWSGDGATLRWSTGPELFEAKVADAFETESKDFEPSASGVDVGFDHPYAMPTGTIAFVNARILTMADASQVRGASPDGVIASGTVVVQGNRILAVGPSLQVSIPTDAKVIDLAGKTLMPGLIDAHFHGPQGTGEIQPQSNWETYAALAFGVTTVHDPSNDTSTFFSASEMQKAGLIVAPRLFSTGTILYGAAGSFKAVVDNAEDARSHLRRMKAAGAFSVKSYNQPRRNQRQQIVAAARELDMMVVNEGGALFQHNMTMVLDGHTGIEHSLSVGAIYDDVKQFWGASGVGITPTLVVAFGGIEGERYWYQHTDVFDHPRLTRFVPREGLDARSRRRPMAPEEDYNHFRAARVTAELHEAGVAVGVGAHGQREGLAAHWEMWMLEQGGMSPMNVLRAATIDGARHLGLDGDIGSVEPGKLADIIVLDNDPLKDLRQSESLTHVMINGRLYDAWTMDEVDGPARPAFWWEEASKP